MKEKEFIKLLKSLLIKIKNSTPRLNTIQYNMLNGIENPSNQYCH